MRRTLNFPSRNVGLKIAFVEIAVSYVSYFELNSYHLEMKRNLNTSLHVQLLVLVEVTLSQNLRKGP